MSITGKIEEMRAQKFAESKEVDNVLASVSELEKAQMRVAVVANALDDLIMSLQGDKALINYHFNESNVDGIRTVAETINAKVDALDDKAFEAALKGFEGVFGIKEAKKADTKKEAKKALGFAVPEKG